MKRGAAVAWLGLLGACGEAPPPGHDSAGDVAVAAVGPRAGARQIAVAIEPIGPSAPPHSPLSKPRK